MTRSTVFINNQQRSAETGDGSGVANTREAPSKGGIFAALRRSPLVSADIDLSRLPEDGRKVDI